MAGRPGEKQSQIVDSNPREKTASLDLDRLEVIVGVNLSLIGQKKAPTRHLIGWPVKQKGRKSRKGILGNNSED